MPARSSFCRWCSDQDARRRRWRSSSRKQQCAVRSAATKTNSAAVELVLLQTAVERRQVEWTQLLATERTSKRQRVDDNRKRDVAVAAKMAQGVVKAHAATNVASAKADGQWTSSWTCIGAVDRLIVGL